MSTYPFLGGSTVRLGMCLEVRLVTLSIRPKTAASEGSRTWKPEENKRAPPPGQGVISSWLWLRRMAGATQWGQHWQSITQLTIFPSTKRLGLSVPKKINGQLAWCPCRKAHPLPRQGPIECQWHKEKAHYIQVRNQEAAGAPFKCSGTTHFPCIITWMGRSTTSVKVVEEKAHHLGIPRCLPCLQCPRGGDTLWGCKGLQHNCSKSPLLPLPPAQLHQGPQCQGSKEQRRFYC
jgi:hypothetical protein